jgi:hypothetical protein
LRHTGIAVHVSTVIGTVVLHKFQLKAFQYRLHS